MSKYEFDGMVASVCAKFRVQPEMRALSENEKYQLTALLNAEVEIIDEKYHSAKVVKKQM
jgi:hypothetical protein